MTMENHVDPTATPPPRKGGSATMWIGVGIVFALMALAWTAMFFFASKYRAETVPLPPRDAPAS
jgi:flagellar basal body-associated protein FliL